MNYYPHHIADFNNSTRHLTRVERSVYRDAIERYYDTEQPLTSDFDALAKRLLCFNDEEKTALKSVLKEFFIETDSGFIHERCEEEIEKYRANSSAKARAGKASAEARRLKKAERQHKQTEHKHNSTRVHNQEPITNNQEPIKNNRSTDVDRFPEFWSVYPKHAKKKTSREIWKRKKLDDQDDLVDKILKDISERLSSDCRWREGFIPDPTTYLNQERWDDEIDTGGRNAHQKPTGKTEFQGTALERWEAKLNAGELG